MKRALSECHLNCPALHYRVYDTAVQIETAFITLDLTFLHTSFANLFCQKKVKKICKSAVRVFFKDADIMCEEAYGMYTPFRRLVYTGGDIMNLLLR